MFNLISLWWILDHSFDYCDPFKALEEELFEDTTNESDELTVDDWLDVWGNLVGSARKMDDLPMWLQFYPKTLFDTINRSGTGVISKTELKLFYTAFLGEPWVKSSSMIIVFIRCWESWINISGQDNGQCLQCDDEQWWNQVNISYLQAFLPQLLAW